MSSGILTFTGESRIFVTRIDQVAGVGDKLRGNKEKWLMWIVLVILTKE